MPRRVREQPAPAPRRVREQAHPPLRIERPASRVTTRERVQTRRRARPGIGLLDRIVRGRAWIPVLGVLLVAIVGMRVEVLKLGSSVGAQMQQASQLQSQNAVLRAQVSGLSDPQRIENLAAKMGMVMPGALDVHFVQASSAANVGRAIRGIKQPAPTTFLYGLEDERVTDSSAELASGEQSSTGTGTGAGTSAGTTTAGGATSSTSSLTSSTGADAPTDASSTDATETETGGEVGTPASNDVQSTANTDDAAATQPQTTGAGSSVTAVTESSSTGSQAPTQPEQSTGANGGASLAG
ncbi:MAG TPA: hypothetical protein VME01_12030 [Solirubrobacteraceae bacterium]|nr:hypothetical protein [Solirubrobacteraceae bacterium]